jgi:hypothetical protein
VITDFEEETQDIDWFSVDASGEIAHFASGGRGFLPLTVRASKEDLQYLTSYFRKELARNGDGVESPHLVAHMRFESEEQKAAYLADYSQMGAKGLYSFDCMVGPKRPSGYFLVVEPSRPLRIEGFPSDIRQVLLRTRFLGTFSTSDVVQETEFVRGKG